MSEPVSIHQRKRFTTSQHFPFFSVLFLILLILWQTLNTHPALNFLSENYPFVLQVPFQYSLMAVVGLIVIWDVLRFYRRRRVINDNIDLLKQEIEDVWESKKHLQQKAHVYSGHADKLKLFISDRLLEYIEYDEKFLHFKSIAAEVRHNGVISYDIVRTALNTAKQAHSAGDVSNDTGYDQALDSMKYLWDLLDLSTADNLSMHIADHLIECEEQYYQWVLNRESGLADGSSFPYQPCFDAADIAEKTLNALIGSVSESTNETNELINDQFRFFRSSVQPLLGNPNHIRLILENLLKNAQHFSRKVPFRQKTDRIALSISQKAKGVELQVYNRGPHIEEENTDKLFRPGYSTRRAKEHHGKGLGLFFVNEIVKGYEGHVAFLNLENHADDYVLRTELKNGDVDTRMITVGVDENTGLPVIQKHDCEQEDDRSLRYSYASPVVSVEISSGNMKETHRFSPDEKNGRKVFTDPENPGHPSWQLSVQPKHGRNKTHNVLFSPLDAKGVQWTIILPDAETRQENEAYLQDL